MPVLTGTPLALPAYANVAAAYADELPLNYNPSAFVSGFKNDGAAIIVPISVCAIIITSAAAGNRVPNLEVQNADGKSIFIVPIGAVVGPSVGMVANWLPSVATAFAILTYQLAPLPAVQLQPGYSIQVNIGAGQAGDAYQQVLILAARFPTNAQPAAPAPVQARTV